MSLQKVNTSDRILGQMQDYADRAISDIQASLFQNGVLLTGVSLTTGQDNLISHGLTRVPQIWLIVGQDTSATVWSPTSASLSNASRTASYLNLRCSATCTVSVWVA